MDKIKATLREEAEIEDHKTVQVYDVGHYEVTVTGWKNDHRGRVSIHIERHRTRPKYLPAIDVAPGNTREVWVDTTSYGSLRMEEIRLFMGAMETCVTTARYIQKKFVDPINNGTWNWDAAEKDNSKNLKALVEVSDGETFCGNCGAEISCNEYGDTPDFCPNCEADLDYSQID